MLMHEVAKIWFKKNIYKTTRQVEGWYNDDLKNHSGYQHLDKYQ